MGLVGEAVAWFEGLEPTAQVFMVVLGILLLTKSGALWNEIIGTETGDSDPNYSAVHLQQAEHDTFERLVSEAYSSQGYATQVTSSGAIAGSMLSPTTRMRRW